MTINETQEHSQAGCQLSPTHHAERGQLSVATRQSRYQVSGISLLIALHGWRGAAESLSTRHIRGSGMTWTCQSLEVDPGKVFGH